uniref:NADH-ubiquinone oxidoreductase chain 4L n=1 Tax=Atrina pectinata TaxID=49198 RepID=L0EST2_ATRPE|nr:NADH dehydrogenase subunit 4L [Atrina pectinata]AGA63951.1 NADH dehydrogenase subunit 4L [Atrina pectinata]UZT27158.1 NADH dehydrogenase subunit 4L [Atrina pectinata]
MVESWCWCSFGWLGLVFSFFCVAGACNKQRHLLAFLLLMEGSSMGIAVAIAGMGSWINFGFFMMFLTFSACETSVGLSLLVSLIRATRSGYVRGRSMLSC